MKLQKTQFVSSKELGKNYSKPKNKRFIYEFVHSIRYKLRNKLIEQLEKINYDKWKKPLIHKIIDIIFNGTMIGLGIACLRTSNVFLIGIGLTLLLIILQSYVKEYKQLFAKR